MPADNANEGKNSAVDNAETRSLVILIGEDELFAVEEKREELRKHRCSLLEACRKVSGYSRLGQGAGGGYSCSCVAVVVCVCVLMSCMSVVV